MSRHPSENQPQRSLWETTTAENVPDGCFSDEIAIDFPAVSHLVERVRDAFLGERPRLDMLTTEISLSRHDARVGAIIPLDVPLRGTCRRCGGRGESWTEPCAACRGTGSSLVHQPVRFALPAGVSDGARFRFRVRVPDASPVKVEVRVAIRSSAA